MDTHTQVFFLRSVYSAASNNIPSKPAVERLIIYNHSLSRLGGYCSKINSTSAIFISYVCEEGKASMKAFYISNAEDQQDSSSVWGRVKARISFAE